MLTSSEAVVSDGQAAEVQTGGGQFYETPAFVASGSDGRVARLNVHMVCGTAWMSAREPGQHDINRPHPLQSGTRTPIGGFCLFGSTATGNGSEASRAPGRICASAGFYLAQMPGDRRNGAFGGAVLRCKPMRGGRAHGVIHGVTK